MRLLFESESPTELSQAKGLLEDNGIPTFISSVDTYRLRPSAVLYKKGLWICLEEQFTDAAELLKNPNHLVSKPVDIEAFYRSLEEAQKEPLRGIWLNRDRILTVILSVIVAALAITVLIAVLPHNNFFRPIP